ncbi:MAG TPA: hypothetical protein VFO84_07540 [Dehalococcoidia bacterium]|nr:hypothetical protein [Dehalococcoidia bacterium]
MMHPETHIRTARITHSEVEAFNSKQYRQMKADEKARRSAESEIRRQFMAALDKEMHLQMVEKNPPAGLGNERAMNGMKFVLQTAHWLAEQMDKAEVALRESLDAGDDVTIAYDAPGLRK